MNTVNDISVVSLLLASSLVVMTLFFPIGKNLV